MAPAILNLAGKRRSAARKLPDTAMIYQAATVPDGEGGHTQGWSLRAGSPVACRFTTLLGIELERAQQIVAEAQFSVTLPALTEVDSTDRIVITRSEGGAGESFGVEVVYVTEKSEPITGQVLAKNLNA